MIFCSFSWSHETGWYMWWLTWEPMVFMGIAYWHHGSASASHYLKSLPPFFNVHDIVCQLTTPQPARFNYFPHHQVGNLALECARAKWGAPCKHVCLMGNTYNSILDSFQVEHSARGFIWREYFIMYFILAGDSWMCIRIQIYRLQIV